MALTREFKETVRARVARDPAFRRALFQEAVQALLDGDGSGGRTVLRDFINATIGFEALAQRTDLPTKSLMRMFGPKGNPQAKHLLAVIAALQLETGLQIEVRAVRRAA